MDGHETGGRAAPGGLLARLGQAPDPRSRHGRRYPIGAVLGIAVAAVVAGAQTYREIAEFAAELDQEQLAELGVPQRSWEVRRRAPGEFAIRQLLQRLDADRIDELVGAWLAEQLPESRQQAVAVDGKSVRGAIGEGGRPVHLLAALVHDHGVVVAQRRVPGKGGEVGMFAPLLEQVALAGRVVTADAAHTQAGHARYLVERRQAAYLLVVKGNQPGLQQTIDRLPPAVFSPRTHHG